MSKETGYTGGSRVQGQRSGASAGLAERPSGSDRTNVGSRTAGRVAVLASADAELCQRLRESLGSLRWRSHTAGGGAAALALIEEVRPQALILDGWLPDLKPEEVAKYVLRLHPELEVVYLDGSAEPGSAKGPHRAELQQVVREAAGEKAARAGAVRDKFRSRGADALQAAPRAEKREGEISTAPGSLMRAALRPAVEFLPEMIGGSEPMRELARMIRLVAPRSTTVLIEGETGTGKEVVAKAVHRLSSRVNKPLVVMNCAAIPEALLEAELFGHTRGAFTGAVQSRTGRVEAADGGTLFLDEIGEMPIALQAKMLRFLECGELQRVGDNQPTYVDVRVIAATHQPLEQRAEERLFRLDLYHRLSVFPIEVPALRSRMEDLPALTEHFLAILGRTAPRKRLSAAAMECLKQHRWPGNVRELMHVLERAVILAGDGAEIGEAEIRLRRRERPASSQMQLYP